MASLGLAPISIAGKTGGDLWTLALGLAGLTGMAGMIIFDCDGVLIAGLHGYGVEMDTAFVSRNFLGRSYPAVLAEVRTQWGIVRPGTRTSRHANPEYQKVPFANMTLDSINSADPTNPTVDPVPYVGVQFVAIPEFQGIATTVGQHFSAALAGTMTMDEALAAAQETAVTEMTKAGYIK